MKNIISKSLLIAALSLSMVSCEEFLTENDPNTITVETFWQNPSDAMQGLAAAYGALQQAAVMGGNEA